jgi:hypothetical protein
MLTVHQETIAQIIVKQLCSSVDGGKAGVNEIATFEVFTRVLATVYLTTSDVILCKSVARRPNGNVATSASTSFEMINTCK